MNSSVSQDAVARLQRLDRYLQEDPANPSLLADACEMAITAGDHDRAAALIETADKLHLDQAEWTFRRARLSIARRDLAAAAALLVDLQRTHGEHPAITHDLAYVHFLEGKLEESRALVQPWLDREGIESEQLEALQCLWLRAMHQLQRLQDAWTRISRELADGRLLPGSQGVASLIALDMGRFEAAKQLSKAALSSRPEQPEALVARATVAMAEGDNPGAVQLLEQALHANPQDGRTWAALGMASLQGGALAVAQEQLERAVASSMQEHVGTWHALGWARFLQGDRPGASAAFQLGLELDRNFAESHGAVALMLGLAGDRSQAEHHLRIADKLDPANVTGRSARAVLAGEVKDGTQLADLLGRLLARPGFLGGTLADSIQAALKSRG